MQAVQPGPQRGRRPLAARVLVPESVQGHLPDHLGPGRRVRSGAAERDLADRRVLDSRDLPFPGAQVRDERADGHRRRIRVDESLRLAQIRGRVVVLDEQAVDVEPSRADREVPVRGLLDQGHGESRCRLRAGRGPQKVGDDGSEVVQEDGCLLVRVGIERDPALLVDELRVVLRRVERDA